MISGKQIHFNIDFEKTTPLYCEFLRGDSIEFHFDFNDTYNATKMRVLCYTKHGQYAFGDEFTNLNVATFYTNRTAGYSGLATITVQLLDDNENLINSANIACKIIESNTQTPFIVSPDFAEKSKAEIAQLVSEGKSQIVEATSNAKEEIDSWSDQSQRLANNEANISNLQLFKANSGALHFNGGNAQCSKLGLQQKQQFSFAVRIKANKNDVLIKKQVNIIEMGVYLFYLYIHPSIQRLSVYAAGTGNSLKSVTTEQNNRIFDGNWHSLFVTYDGTTLTLSDEYGVLLTVNYSIQEQTIGTKFGYNFVGQMQDICIFNFDMLADDAPYTIEDYKNGKAIPPSILDGTQTILALENYTITNGTTQMIFDYSGNNNDSTVTGIVKGDNDNRIAKLIDFIKA